MFILSFPACPTGKLSGLVACAIVLTGFLAQASAQSRACKDPTPVGNLNEMFDAIFACWVPPEDTEGLVVTLQFILHKDGRIRDKVVVIAGRPQEDSPRRQAKTRDASSAGVVTAAAILLQCPT